MYSIRLRGLGFEVWLGISARLVDVGCFPNIFRTRRPKSHTHRPTDPKSYTRHHLRLDAWALSMGPQPF